MISVQKLVVTYDEPQLIASEKVNNINNLVNDYLLNSDNNFNLTELDDLTFLVTENLRQSGLMLAKAILPAQEVESGTVVIHVFVGKFGGVNSDANCLIQR